MPANLSRRGFLAGAASAGLDAALAPASAETYYVNLGRIAHDSGVQFGAAVGGDYYADATYAGLFEEARFFVSEWQFKLASLRPTRAAYDFYNADKLVALGIALRKPVKAHCLFWQSANPAWLGGLSTAELQYVFDEHIDKVVPRYAGKVFAWDVVNEPFWPADGLDGGFGNGPWYQAFGSNWPLRAFKRISTLDRKARFVLNESQCDNNAPGLGGTIRPALLQLIDTLQQAGANVHAIGLESHLDLAQPYDDGRYAAFIDQLARRKLEVWLSELDVRDFNLPDDVATRDKMVAERVGAYLSNALASPAVKQVATWGLSDKYSWLAALWNQQNGATMRQPRPLPFDVYMQRKPMWAAMANAFQKRKKI